MAMDDSTPRTRRALLGAAAAGAGTLALATLVRPETVAATDPNDVLLGGPNTTATETSITNTGATTGLHVTGGTDAAGVIGTSATAVGVFGRSLDTTPSDFAPGSFRAGVRGTSGDDSNMAVNQDETGVYGYSSVSTWSNGVWGDSTDGTGVYGTGANGLYGDGYWGVYGFGVTGVIGDADSTGVGVYGFSGDASIPEPAVKGVGVYAKAATTTQTALYVDGKARFSRSKRVSIGASKTSLKVTMGGVTTSSYILATLQTSVSGCYVRAVVPASGYFTIYLSKAPGKTAYIGYLVIN
jgi:hypothetical protein